jgi:Undecaprenyl-phosphate glucose phosphotransferase
VAGLMAGAFFGKVGADFSRVWIATWFVSALLMLFGERLVVSQLVKRWIREGRLNRRAVIVGGGHEAEELIKALEASHDTDIRIAGIFDDRGNDRVSPVVAGYPKLGNIDELVQFARGSRLDLLVVSLPVTAEKRLLQVLKKLWVLPVDIRLSAHNNRLRFRPRTYSYIGNVPFIDVTDKPIADWGHVKKWLFDKIVASLALILLAPAMAVIALLIKFDSKGPVLFRQKRQGFNNELIEVYKFRSMYADQSDMDASKLVTQDDPRVTHIGRILRKTSLDELPQFFNVLKGDLSLVGPRPHALKAKAENKLYSDVVDGYFARHRVKPGVTGWAQISGWRGETDTEEKIERRVEHDLYYIENWSVLFDLYICLMTPLALLKGENAY